MSAETPEPLVYPVAFPLKVFLKPDAAAEREILAGIEACLNAGNKVSAERSLSSGGKYLCLRVDYQAQDEAEVARVRAFLKSDARVIMSL